jgi:RNA polymerase sigma-70 factor (sigma-E family)
MTAREGRPEQPDLEIFVRAHHGGLLRRAYLLTGSHADAEDLVQETLARVWVAGRSTAIEAPGAYLQRVMVNLATSRWRRLRRMREAPTGAYAAFADRPGVVGHLDPAERMAEQDRMWTLLRTLPPRQRTVLVLRYYEDLPETRVADLLGVSVGTVRSQTWKALRHLKTRLASEQPAEASQGVPHD